MEMSWHSFDGASQGETRELHANQDGMQQTHVKKCIVYILRSVFFSAEIVNKRKLEQNNAHTTFHKNRKFCSSRSFLLATRFLLLFTFEFYKVGHNSNFFLIDTYHNNNNYYTMKSLRCDRREKKKRAWDQLHFHFFKFLISLFCFWFPQRIEITIVLSSGECSFSNENIIKFLRSFSPFLLWNMKTITHTHTESFFLLSLSVGFFSPRRRIERKRCAGTTIEDICGGSFFIAPQI